MTSLGMYLILGELVAIYLILGELVAILDRIWRLAP